MMMNRLNEEEKPQQNVRKAQERDKDAFLGSSRDGGFFWAWHFSFFPRSPLFARYFGERFHSRSKSFTIITL